MGIFGFTLILFLHRLGVPACGFVDRHFVGIDFFQHHVVKESVARGEPVLVVGAVFAESEIEGERGGARRRALDINGVRLPFALRVDAGNLGVTRGGNVYPRSGDVVIVVRARDVVGEHVNGQLIVRVRVQGEGRRSVAVGGGTEIVIVVFGAVFRGHINHQHVVDRVFCGRVVRAQPVVKRLSAVVRAAVVVPEFAVGGVERLFEAYRARGDVAGNGGRGVNLRAGPVGDGAGIITARADDFEV